MNMKFLQDKLMAFANAIQRNKYVTAVSTGLLSTMPLMIVGAFGSIINSFGIQAYQDFLKSSGLKYFTNLPNEIGTNLFALFAVFSIGYQFANGEDKDGKTAGIISLMAFLFLTPLTVNESGSMTAIPSTWLGATGLFVAMIIGLLSSKIYCIFDEKGITIKLPDSVPPVITRTFGAILPALTVAAISLALSFAFSKTAWGSMHGAVYALIAKPLTTLGGSFPALLIAVLFTHVLWSIGIHGTMVALSVFYPIWASLDMQNLAAYNSGAPIPNIVSMQFFFFVAFAGGAGNTIALIINMLTSKVASNKALGRLGLIPGLFGINEPIIFGMPIVMNPLLIMPFILSPMITTILGYIVCKMGIIAAPSGIASIPGAPIIVNQFLMGGWTWAVFEVVIIIISYLIYFPFFKILEKQQLSNQNTEEAQGREAIIKEGFENATK